MSRTFWVLANGQRDTTEEFTSQHDAQQYALREAKLRLATRFAIVELVARIVYTETSSGVKPEVKTTLEADH